MVIISIFTVAEAGESLAHDFTEYEARHISLGIELLYQLDTRNGLDPRSRSPEGLTDT